MKKTKSKTKNYLIAITILCVALIVVNILNITLAFFTDRDSTDSKSSLLTFGTIKIDAYFKEDSGNLSQDFTFATSDVSTGSVIQRKIVVKNADDAERCALRIYYKFEVDAGTGDGYKDVSSSNYLKLSVQNESKWTGYSKYLYYNSAIASGENIEETVKFEVQDNFGRYNLEQDLGVSNLKNVNYRISLYFEAVQVANDGYINAPFWEGQTPDNWTLA